MMRENRNIVERTGATSELSSRRNLVGMLSGPDALLGLRLASSFSTPDVVIVIAGDFGKGLGPTLGRGRLLVVKTDEYCSFRMSALPFESEMRTPSFFRGGTRQKSFLLLLMHDQNFLLVSGFCRGLSSLFYIEETFCIFPMFLSDEPLGFRLVFQVGCQVCFLLCF